MVLIVVVVVLVVVVVVVLVVVIVIIDSGSVKMKNDDIDMLAIVIINDDRYHSINITMNVSTNITSAIHISIVHASYKKISLHRGL